MARDKTARGADQKRSLLDRRSYLKLAGASAAAVAGLGSSTAAAQSDGVILEEGFANSEYDKWFTSAWRQGEQDQVTTQDSRSNGSCLHVDLPEGSHYGMAATIDPKDAGLVAENPRELYASYWVKFGAGFEMGSHGFACKLPGFQNHERRDGGSAGEPSDGTNGWAARGMFTNAGSNVELGYYCYHMDQSGNYGDMFDATTIADGEWHRVEQRMKLNTVSGDRANRDGVLTMWIDGERQYHDDSMAFTLAPERGINYAFQVYYGGNEPSPADNDIYIDDWKLATSRLDGDEGDLLELVTNSEAQNVEYDFTVDGSVSKNVNADNIAAERNDTITANDDGTKTVSGVSGNGHGDSFWVDGPIRSMSLDESQWTIRYDGEEVSVEDVVQSAGPSIDRFEISKSEQLGDDRMFSVQWAASAAEDALDTVEVVVVENVSDLNFAVTDVSGGNASGWDLFQFPVDTELDVSLRVQDAAENVAKETKSITL